MGLGNRFSKKLILFKIRFQYSSFYRLSFLPFCRLLVHYVHFPVRLQTLVVRLFEFKHQKQSHRLEFQLA